MENENKLEITYQQAKNFMQVRRWWITEGEHENNFCENCNMFHPVAAENMLIGINRFHSEQEFIDWVKKLITNSI